MLPELITFVQFSWWRPPKSMISKNPSERKDEPNLPETVPTFDFSSEIQPTKQIKLMTMQDPIEKNIGKYHIATDCSRNISSLVKRIRNWRSIKVEIAKSNSTLSTKNQQPPPPNPRLSSKPTILASEKGKNNTGLFFKSEEQNPNPELLRLPLDTDRGKLQTGGRERECHKRHYLSVWGLLNCRREGRGCNGNVSGLWRERLTALETSTRIHPKRRNYP